MDNLDLGLAESRLFQDADICPSLAFDAESPDLAQEVEILRFEQHAVSSVLVALHELGRSGLQRLVHRVALRILGRHVLGKRPAGACKDP